MVSRFHDLTGTISRVMCLAGGRPFIAAETSFGSPGRDVLCSDDGVSWRPAAPLPHAIVGSTHVIARLSVTPTGAEPYANSSAGIIAANGGWTNRTFHILFGGWRDDGQQEAWVARFGGHSQYDPSDPTAWALPIGWVKLKLSRALFTRVGMLATWLPGMQQLLVGGGDMPIDSSEAGTFDRPIAYSDIVLATGARRESVSLTDLHTFDVAPALLLIDAAAAATAPATSDLFVNVTVSGVLTSPRLPQPRPSPGIYGPDAYTLSAVDASDRLPNTSVVHFMCGRELWDALIPSPPMGGSSVARFILRRHRLAGNDAWGRPGFGAIYDPAFDAPVSALGLQRWDDPEYGHIFGLEPLTGAFRKGSLVDCVVNSSCVGGQSFSSQCIASPFEAVCKPCSTCKVGVAYVGVQCNVRADTLCEPCLPCAINMRILTACGTPGAPPSRHVCVPIVPRVLPMLDEAQVSAVTAAVACEAALAGLGFSICVFRAWWRGRSAGEAGDSSPRDGKKAAGDTDAVMQLMQLRDQQRAAVQEGAMLWLLIFTTQAALTIALGHAVGALSGDGLNLRLRLEITAAMLALVLSLIPCALWALVLVTQARGAREGFVGSLWAWLRQLPTAQAVLIPLMLWRPQVALLLLSGGNADSTTTIDVLDRSARVQKQRAQLDAAAAKTGQRLNVHAARAAVRTLTSAACLLSDLPLLGIFMSLIIFARDATADPSNRAVVSPQLIALPVAGVMLCLWHLCSGVLALGGAGQSAPSGRIGKLVAPQALPGASAGGQNGGGGGVSGDGVMVVSMSEVAWPLNRVPSRPVVEVLLPAATVYDASSPAATLRHTESSVSFGASPPAPLDVSTADRAVAGGASSPAEEPGAFALMQVMSSRAATPEGRRLATMRTFFSANPHLLQSAASAVALTPLPAAWHELLRELESRAQLDDDEEEEEEGEGRGARGGDSGSSANGGNGGSARSSRNSLDTSSTGDVEGR